MSKKGKKKVKGERAFALMEACNDGKIYMREYMCEGELLPEPSKFQIVISIKDVEMENKFFKWFLSLGLENSDAKEIARRLFIEFMGWEFGESHIILPTDLLHWETV